jgi:hypothetical protein
MLIFDQTRTAMAERKPVTWADIFGRLAEHLTSGKARPFDHAMAVRTDQSDSLQPDLVSGCDQIQSVSARRYKASR